MTKVLLTLAAAGLLLSGSANAQYNEDPTGADTYVTYAFHDACSAPRPELLSQAIMKAMDDWGRVKVPQKQADVLIACWAGLSGELIIDAAELDVSVDEAWLDEIAVAYPIGSVVIVAIDYSANELIWLGTGSAPLSRMPDREEVSEVVFELLSSLPLER